MVLLILVAVMSAALPASATSRDRGKDNEVRFATFNASLNRDNGGDLIAELQAAVDGEVSDQLAAVLEIIAVNEADVLLVNEFDYDDDHVAAALFAQLSGYEYYFTAPSNTGVPSGFDFDNDGSTDGPGDAYGFGFHPGQFGMLVLSKLPIDTKRVRTFQNFLWADMPDALLPIDPATGESWYSEEELAVFRLSSKSHWDVPIKTDRGRVHFLVSHPTPPVFDGDEDRNGTRNHDEIRFWADYVSGWKASRYIHDDNGRRGGLWWGSRFVIAGDQNADPNDGDSVPGAIDQLLDLRRVNTKVTPSSEGAVEAATVQGADNDDHLSDPAFDTADFGEAPFGPGNLRVDYVLPSRNMTITDAAVFWPTLDDPRSELTGTFPFPSSDHRLVWVDVKVRRW